MEALMGSSWLLVAAEVCIVLGIIVVAAVVCMTKMNAGLARLESEIMEEIGVLPDEPGYTQAFRAARPLVELQEEQRLIWFSKPALVGYVSLVLGFIMLIVWALGRS